LFYLIVISPYESHFCLSSLFLSCLFFDEAWLPYVDSNNNNDHDHPPHQHCHDDDSIMARYELAAHIKRHNPTLYRDWIRSGILLQRGGSLLQEDEWMKPYPVYRYLECHNFLIPEELVDDETEPENDDSDDDDLNLTTTTTRQKPKKRIGPLLERQVSLMYPILLTTTTTATTASENEAPNNCSMVCSRSNDGCLGGPKATCGIHQVTLS
jgi:hypothetical protein